MKAALLIESEVVRIEEVDDPVIKPGEILVELKSCGVCATDVKKFTGKSKSPFLPFILGHEPAGIVRALGENTTTQVKGRRSCGDHAGDHLRIRARDWHKRADRDRWGMGMCDHYEVIGLLDERRLL